ncbi:hypothetical protein AAC387_Pa06g1190 [Persea americana]
MMLESLITKDATEADIQGVIAEVPEMILKCVSRDEAGLAVAQKVCLVCIAAPFQPYFALVLTVI